VAFLKGLGVSILLTILSMGIANAANVVVFYNATYVDTGATGSAEATNEIATLTAQGHTVTTFTGITATAITAATAGQDVLVIPELENGDLNAALNAAARTAIHDFVTGGGQLIINGQGTSHEVDLLNAIFGYSLVDSGSMSSGSLAGPTTLGANNGTELITTASVPPGATILYTANAGADTAVFVNNEGAGQVIFLAWDWFNAVPVGAADNGWLAVLDAAVKGTLAPKSPSAVPTLSQWALMLMVLLLGVAGYNLSRSKKGF